MKEIKGLLFDIGGVLYVGEDIIPGAPAAIAKLRKRFPLRFLTNTTRKTPMMMQEKLRKMGFPVEENELFTALDATKRYLVSRKGSVYTILTDEAGAWFAELESEHPDFVVVGDAHLNFDYRRLNGAFRALEGGAELIAAAKNRYFRDEDGALSMDAGGFIEALEYAADVKATIIGKPSRTFFGLALDAMGLKADEVLMVGDDIEADIKGAQDAGLKTALVKTGKYQASDLDLGIKPDVIVEDVVALADRLLTTRDGIRDEGGDDGTL